VERTFSQNDIDDAQHAVVKGVESGHWVPSSVVLLVTALERIEHKLDEFNTSMSERPPVESKQDRVAATMRQQAWGRGAAV
jgi:hypothetical protein